MKKTEKLTSLTASEARYESLIALSKNKENVEKYEAILEAILEAAKQGQQEVLLRNEYFCDYAHMCLVRDGFRLLFWDYSVTVEWKVYK